MKWAPNKKLHFEVALIKAIQTLSQVTLNEVIESLNALRDGKSVPTPKAENHAAGSSSSRRPATQPAQKKVPEMSAAAPKEQPAAVVSEPAKIWEQVCAKV